MPDNTDPVLSKVRASFPNPTLPNPTLDAKQGDGYYEGYSHFTKSLRGWLVAYGIGAPVLFASQSALAPVLNDTIRSAPIIWMFFAGLFIQVGMAMFFKYAMWALYCGETVEGYKSLRRYKILYFICDWTIIEFILDLASVTLYLFATALFLQAYVDTHLPAQQAAHAGQKAAGVAQEAAQSAQQAVQKLQASPAKPPAQSP